MLVDDITVEGDVCPYKGLWSVEQWLLERAARYQAQQPVDLTHGPAWQAQGVRQVLTLDAEERQAERWRQQAQQHGR